MNSLIWFLPQHYEAVTLSPFHRWRNWGLGKENNYGYTTSTRESEEESLPASQAFAILHPK